MTMLPIKWVESEQSLPRTGWTEHWTNWSPGVPTTGMHALGCFPSTRVEGAYAVLGHAFVRFGSEYMVWYRMAHPVRPACLSCSFNFHRAGTSRTGGLVGGKGVSCVCVQHSI